MKTRREFLLGSAAVAVVAVMAPVVAPATCAAVHRSLATGYAALRRDAHFAANSVLTAARDIYCPYCGEPVVEHV